jgi:GT2 family glycosyltransferase/2-polyprenyl-3-methyl-5-hydroxy-6-metoxy-1,4-benzoquinol methylase
MTTASDLTVVIPTRERWDILGRTLAALRDQSAGGFETIVVVDGRDQRVPDLERALPGVRVLVQDHAGPGAARNHGAAATDRRLVLFLGDDMVPTPHLVADHLARHDREHARETAVLGRVEWHPELGRHRLLRWLDWSGTQFDYRWIPTEGEAGFGRFFSCNVSVDRGFFLEAGGFDPDFVFYYEDLDCGWRLGQRGMRLVYEPAALVHHLHGYDTAALERRFEGIARGERMMAAKHPWFEPWFARRVLAAEGQPPVSRLWPALVDVVPDRAGRVRRAAEVRADRWYHQRVAHAFLRTWDGIRDLDELREYLGDAYDDALLRGHAAAVDAEEHGADDETTFYRTSQMYLYDLTVFAMSGTKLPYLRALTRAVPRGSRVLDWGCGIGADGVRLIDRGYDVSFADFDNPSVKYLRWRLAHRGLDADVFDIEHDDIPTGFDAAYSLDVIEHVEDPFAFLDELERRAAVVMVNFLEPTPDDTHLHKPLPITALLDHAARRGLVHYRRYHGRSHLVVYRTGVTSPARRARSAIERVAGRYARV